MIDASIPLQVRPPQFEDPMQAYGKALTLKNLMQQQQSGQLGIEREQMQNQAMRQDLADQQLMKDAYGQAGGDLDKLPGMLAGKVSPKTLMALNASILEHRQKMAGLTKDELAIAKGHTEAIAAASQALLSAPPEQRPAVWQTVRPQLLQGKHGTEADFPAAYPGDQWVQTHGQMAIAADKQIDQALAADKEKREKAESNARMPGIVADAGMKTAVAAGMANPDDAQAQQLGMTPDQRAQLKLRAEEVAKLNTPAELAAKASDPKSPPEMRDAAKAALKILEQHAIASRPVTQLTVLPTAGGGPQAQLTGEEFLKTLSPGTAGQVKAVAEGRATLPSATSRSQAAIQLRDAVFRYDPSYSDQRAQIRKAFTTGSDGRNIGALNTATVHLDQFAEAAKAMGNGSFRPGNAIFNAIVTEFGGSAPTNLAGLKTAVAGELASALKGTATDPEIADIKKAIESKNSPQQLADYVKTQIHVLHAKLNTYRERYQQQMPGDTVWSPVLPSARGVYERYGIGGAPAQDQTGGKKPLSEIFK